MGRVGWAVALFGALVFAGCAAPTVTTGEDPNFDGLEGEATDTTGIIRGVVVDQSITPVMGVIITVGGLPNTATTNANGAFVLSELEPGTYFLTASRAGYENVQASATVAAGVDNPPVLKIQMVADPATVPYVSPFVFEGYIQCSEDLILVGYSGGCDNDFLVDYTVAELGRTPEFAQSEMIWESTQPAGDRMSFLYSAPREGQTLLYNYQEQEGESPLVLRANTTLMEENGVINSYPLELRVFSSSIEGTDIGKEYGDPTDGDNCIERPQLGGCTRGLGATIEQSFDAFTHAFFNWEPSPEWQFSVDGAPVVPS